MMRAMSFKPPKVHMFQSSGLQTFKPIQNYQMGFCFLWLEGSQEGLKEAEGTDKAQEALCTTRGDGEAW